MGEENEEIRLTAHGHGDAIPLLKQGQQFWFRLDTRQTTGCDISVGLPFFPIDNG